MNTKEQGMTYSASGVDIDAGNLAVEMIKKRVEGTFPLIRTGKVISDLGGFGAVVELPNGTILVATTDGVGTKLVVAILLNRHDTIGVDLGAMCFNDLLATGAYPLIFLDYVVQGKQIPKKTAEIINGIIDGCEQAGSPLVGGEMAECPDLYEPEVYDLAGFAVGMAGSRKDLILGNEIAAKMNVYGITSSGLHSNGYSLVRKITGISLKTPVASIDKLHVYIPELGCTLGEELLRPTTIYVKVVEYLMHNYEIKGMANITGGGLLENPPRILPPGLAMIIDLKSWQPQPIFSYLQKRGNISQLEMLRVTNYGIGFIFVSPNEIIEEGVLKIGKVIEHSEKRVFFDFTS